MTAATWLTTSANVRIPPILYGTAWKKERTTDLVLTAFKAGFRGIDTACQPKHYAEPLVGAALKTLQQQGIARSDYYLQTKFTPVSGQDPNNIPYDPDAPLATQVAQSFSCSQANLHTEYLDGLILHSPLPTHARTLEAWRAMEQIHREGGARQLGISNCYSLDKLMALYTDADVKPALVQNRFYRDSGYDMELREWCRSKNILYQSFWTLTANPDLLASDVMTTLAHRHSATPAQILFAYLSRNGVVPLTGTTSGQHMAQDLACFDIPLQEVELTGITQLLQSAVSK